MKTLRGIFLAGFLAVSMARPAHALIVNDPINTAVNTLRNTLMEIYHIEDLANTVQQLFELRRTFEELKRFHDGIDDIADLLIGDYRRFLRVFHPGSWTDLGYELSRFQRDFYGLLNGSLLGGASDFRTALNEIFGEDPQSQTKPYITEEEMFAADGFRWSSEIRKIVDRTIDAGEDISRASHTSSPKGSARLTADALGKILVTQAQIHQNQAKQIELTALQVEQTSREEKNYERERIKFMREFNKLLDVLPLR